MVLQVLLYNFFEDSAVDASHWRVVLNALEDDGSIKPPRFDEVRHSSVCREVSTSMITFPGPLPLHNTNLGTLQLKFLYVASTRARMNLWLADGSDKAEPMRVK